MYRILFSFIVLLGILSSCNNEEPTSPDGDNSGEDKHIHGRYSSMYDNLLICSGDYITIEDSQFDLMRDDYATYNLEVGADGGEIICEVNDDAQRLLKYFDGCTDQLDFDIENCYSYLSIVSQYTCDIKNMSQNEWYDRLDDIIIKSGGFDIDYTNIEPYNVVFDGGKFLSGTKKFSLNFDSNTDDKPKYYQIVIHLSEPKSAEYTNPVTQETKIREFIETYATVQFIVTQKANK